MKYIVAFLVITFTILSCKDNSSRKEESKKQVITNNSVVLTGSKTIDLAKSSIYWKGYKLIGNHTGKIDLVDGSLEFDNGDITAGEFVANMKSIKVTELMDDGDDEEEEDDEESPEDDKSDLASHLMDADFFNSEQFPTASFKIKNSTKEGNNYTIAGDMTIKGVTKEITFDAQIVDDTLQSEVAINRTDFGIKYGSGSFFKNLGDNVIKDEFDLILSLKIK